MILILSLTFLRSDRCIILNFNDRLGITKRTRSSVNLLRIETDNRMKIFCSFFIFSYYASTVFPHRLAPPLKRQRLMPSARCHHKPQQKQQPQPSTSMLNMQDMNQLKVYSELKRKIFIIIILHQSPSLILILFWKTSPNGHSIRNFVSFSTTSMTTNKKQSRSKDPVPLFFSVIQRTNEPKRKKQRKVLEEEQEGRKEGRRIRTATISFFPQAVFQ